MYTVQDKKRLCLALILLDSPRQKKRTQWAREWLKRKDKGCYQNLMVELSLQDAEGYRRWIRMDTATFELLLSLVSPFIQKQDTNMRKAIPAGEKLAITLRYLATGHTQTDLQYDFRVAQNTISTFLPEVCKAIYRVLKDEFLTCPSSEAEWESIANAFHELWNFPSCIGAMDGKHVDIVPPPRSGSKFFNYKQSNSIVLLALADAQLRFLYVDIGTNGRASDGGVWGKSCLKKALEGNALNIPIGRPLPGSRIQVPFVMLADDAFPLCTRIMKPYGGKNLTKEKIIYNYRLSRARRVVENAFGILAARFRIFRGCMVGSVKRIQWYVLAACALHNFLRVKSPTYIDPSSLDREDNGRILRGNWRNYSSVFRDLQRCGGSPSNIAKQVQSRFCTYFNNDGAVSWQDEYCLLH